MWILDTSKRTEGGQTMSKYSNFFFLCLLKNLQICHVIISLHVFLFPYFYWHFSVALWWAVFFCHRPAFDEALFEFSFVSIFLITCQPMEQKAAVSSLDLLAFLLLPQAPTPWPSSAEPCPPVQVLGLPAAAPSACLLQAWGSAEPLSHCFQPSWSEREPLLGGHEALLPLEWARQGRLRPRWWRWWWWGQSSLCLGSSSLKLLAENIPHLVLWATCCGSRLTMRCGSSDSRITW